MRGKGGVKMESATREERVRKLGLATAGTEGKQEGFSSPPSPSPVSVAPPPTQHPGETTLATP